MTNDYYTNTEADAGRFERAHASHDIHDLYPDYEPDPYPAPRPTGPLPSLEASALRMTLSAHRVEVTEVKPLVFKVTPIGDVDPDAVTATLDRARYEHKVSGGLWVKARRLPRLHEEPSDDAPF